MLSKKTLGVIAISGFISESNWRDCQDFFNQRRQKFISSSLITEKNYHFAGTPKQKLKQFLELVPKTNLLLGVRGGSGTIHLLPFLDNFQNQELLAKVNLIGFSDLSILLNYLAQKFKSIVIHSHTANSLRASGYTEKTLFFQRVNGDWKGELAGFYQSDLVCLREGQAQGKLFGGNLASLASLIGTPWEVDFSNKIVFFEDVNEAYYRIERFFSQFHYAGCLKKIKGFVFGNFFYLQGQQRKLDTEKIFEMIKSMLPPKIPVLANFPAGHGGQNAPLPIGAEVFLDTEQMKFFVTK